MCVCVCGCVCWEGHRYLSILVTKSVRVCVRARCEGHRFLSILVAEVCVCVCVCARARVLKWNLIPEIVMAHLQLWSMQYLFPSTSFLHSLR